MVSEEVGQMLYYVLCLYIISNALRLGYPIHSMTSRLKALGIIQRSPKSQEMQLMPLDSSHICIKTATMASSQLPSGFLFCFVKHNRNPETCQSAKLKF